MGVTASYCEHLSEQFAVFQLLTRKNPRRLTIPSCIMIMSNLRRYHVVLKTRMNLLYMQLKI